jgi:hypothetical protein
VVWFKCALGQALRCVLLTITCACLSRTTATLRPIV